ncbi:MAG: NAD(P)H-binding protein [Cellvibrionales bacterium]|nr:NAD(P)H-binding protein [Cellvibrionales bacterium]
MNGNRHGKFRYGTHQHGKPGQQDDSRDGGHRISGTPLLVRGLHASGANVVAVVRNPDKVPELKRHGIELRIADLADRTALSRAFAGCDAVIANAGQVSLSPDYDELIMQNLDGTRNTLHACADAHVQRVVTISSASVYQKIRSDIAIDETAPLRTANDKRNRFSIYPISKALAEQESWQPRQRTATDNDSDSSIRHFRRI